MRDILSTLLVVGTTVMATSIIIGLMLSLPLLLLQ